MAEGTHDLDAVLERAAAWLAEGRRVAFATVVRTWGSSPRPAGSKLACNEAGEFVGSVSGGCIEAAVVTEAIELIGRRRDAGVLSFGVADERAWEVGLACGGRVEVFIEVASAARVQELRDARAAKRAIDLHTPLNGAPSWISAHAGATEPTVVDDVLVEPVLPPLRLMVVGAVHVAAPLARMARIAGFEITIVDPRRAWASPVRFPDETLVTEWPDVALEALRIDARTAIVALTHDPKIDDPALVAAMKSPAFYIGCLGSKKTHAARRERLASAGDALDRLRGPVGLDIGAKSPAEIAVSILAEIIAALRGKDPRA